MVVLKDLYINMGVGWYAGKIKRISRSASKLKFCDEVERDNIWDGTVTFSVLAGWAM